MVRRDLGAVRTAVSPGTGGAADAPGPALRRGTGPAGRPGPVRLRLRAWAGGQPDQRPGAGPAGRTRLRPAVPAPLGAG